MVIEPKTNAIIILTIALFIVSWVALNPKLTPKNYTDELIKQEVDRLSKENLSLANAIALRDVRISNIIRENDSLENLKPKIKIMYDTIYKKINNSGATSVANQFTSVFSNAGIK